MSYAASLAAILLAVSLAVMTPGPSFLMVARISVSQSRRKGIDAALGMGVAGTLLSLLAMLGMRAVFDAAPLFFLVLQFCGGVYLTFIGIRIWRSARTPVVAGITKTNEPMKDSNAFRTAFFVQLSNPNTIMLQSSIFASINPGETSARILAVLLALVFTVHLGWYSLVAVLLSANRPRAAYMRAKVWIDRIAGGLILFLGMKILSMAFRNAPL